ncbi:glycoside hydrolase family 2 protein [Actibacterium mucosum]|nr:glycoside hydrolase family 2 TIM barrel-domain containing protein [Actibacterium mucosum]
MTLKTPVRSATQETLFNENWIFEGGDTVRLPHNAVETPFSYFDEGMYQRAFIYEKRFAYDASWADQDVFVRFDGIMADARISLNGVEVAAHRDGYTPIMARLTDHLRKGENVLTVQIDGSENPEIPPFGGRIDYLTYAGIYRDAWLIVRPTCAIDNVKIETPDALADTKTVNARVILNTTAPEGAKLSAQICDASGANLAQQVVVVCTPEVELSFADLTGLSLWDINDPVLYTLHLALETSEGLHQTSQRFGIRSAEFTPEGFFLNGRALKIRGLNRHQSFPYVGYALGKAAQEKDAEILKHELRLNLVRTSHYPQSTYFLDRCDEIGLLVFEEIPGWQHIGDADWKAESVKNVRRMIERDWNHPSIIIWGVRINESPDDHDFYTETNALSRELDPTRQTGGVRYIQFSEMLEDVYTMNDFCLGEARNVDEAKVRALRPQTRVTGLADRVPYLVTEYNGHMFPTKSTDNEIRLAEHAMRHLEVLNAAYGDPNISGAIGWCAWDYNTHCDFGSGDRICHHGVMDMFREPKFAAYAYASQGNPAEGVVLKPATFWARGERNIGGVLPLLIMTNCDYVELHYGDHIAKRVYPARDRFPHLPHPPVIIEATDFRPDEMGSWGMHWQKGAVRGFIDGECVETVEFHNAPVPTKLELLPDASNLSAHDAVRVLVRVTDQCGHKLPFLPEPVQVQVSGPAKILGPDVIPLRGGGAGFWVQTTGPGEVSVTGSHGRCNTVSFALNVE